MAKLSKNVANDIFMDVSGEPAIVGGDFCIVQGIDAILQSCMFRLKTVIGDFILETSCGASLENLIGEPNSLSTGQRAEQMVLRALTHDAFLTTEEVEVVAQPVNPTTILITVYINYSSISTVLNFSVDLREGQLSFIT